MRRGSCAYFGGGARSWSATGLLLITLKLKFSSATSVLRISEQLKQETSGMVLGVPAHTLRVGSRRRSEKIFFTRCYKFGSMRLQKT